MREIRKKERKLPDDNEPHNWFTSDSFSSVEKTSAFGDVSGVLIYAYRRRCHHRPCRCRCAPLQAASRSPRYFRAISRRLTRLRDHTWASSRTWYRFYRIKSSAWNSFRDSELSYDFFDLREFVDCARNDTIVDRSFYISALLSCSTQKALNRNDAT